MANLRSSEWFAGDVAGSLISAIPAVVVYLIFQRQLVNGLTAGIGK